MNGIIARFTSTAVALVALCGLAIAETVSGPARLVDGDTLIIEGRTVRLHGIDAPETRQTCWDDRGRDYRCGVAALDGLRDLVGNALVTCRGTERDRHDRLIAVCRAGSTDLNSRMVAMGLAIAYRRFSNDYLAEEVSARNASLGLWGGTFEPPEVVRAQMWETAQAAAPAGCPIKGNISANGRIYHTPWSQWYARTRINTARGELWFCTEAEALAAGWRPPYR
ncbi:MAG: thermonuclease family protein [Pseudomonadota bacterium]